MGLPEQIRKPLLQAVNYELSHSWEGVVYIAFTSKGAIMLTQANIKMVIAQTWHQNDMYLLFLSSINTLYTHSLLEDKIILV